MNDKGKEKIQTDLLPLAVNINSPILDPRNAREHPEENLDQIKLSLLRYGQCKPVVVNRRTGIIVAGNGLVLAARELGWLRVAVARVDLTDSEALAYGLMDNKSGLSSTWNLPNLKDVLQDLDTGEFDMKFTGFNEAELEELMTQTHQLGEGLTDEDEVPESVEPICKKGDLWKLCEHRLLCGDAEHENETERLLAGDKADMVLTDPPYGIDLNTDYSGISGGWTGQVPYAKSRKYPKVINDDKHFNPQPIMDVFADVKEVFLFGANYYASILPIGGWFVWDKTEEGHYTTVGSEFELCWSKQRHRQEIIRIVWAGVMGLQYQDVKKRLHATQKPVALFEWFITKFSELNQVIVDLYGGSGTTVIACEKLNRRCFMMEIGPHYCDVIIKRWQDFTGKTAEKLK